MPNSDYVDERVVRMRMDNEQFEKGAERTMGTLDKLKKALKFDKSSDGDMGLSALESSVEKIASKFNAMEYASKSMVENVTKDMWNLAKNLAKQAVTGIDQIRPGYSKYEEQVQAIQKLMIATGESMDVVQQASDKLMKFTDETSYQYDAMLRTMSAFTSSGIALDDSINTILGLAIAAGKSGVSVEQATHAFMGFQKAVANNKMTSSQWDWIKTANFNTKDLMDSLLEAGVAVGTLEKGTDGLYYALEQTKKGVKKTEVSIANFETTFKTGWLNKDVIIKAADKYTGAFNKLYEASKLAENQGKSFETLMEEMGASLDKFSFEALEAGQNTKTFGEAVEAIKTANTSSWMKSFELIIGNFEQAKEFWSNMIGPLWDIFVTPGQKRVGFFEAAFGDAGVEKSTTVSWEKLSKRIEEVGHTTKDLDDAFKKVTGASENAKVAALAKTYGTLEAAIEDGVVDADLLKQILNEISGVTTEATEEAVAGAEGAKHAFEEYLDVAKKVINGELGNGEERKKNLEELGYDYEMIQWLAGNMINGMSAENLNLDWIKEVAPQHYEHFIEILGNGIGTVDDTTDALITMDQVMVEYAEDAETASMTGRQLWQESVLRIVTALADAFTQLGDAFDEVFGTPEKRGKGFRGWLIRLYNLTEGLKLSEKTLESVKNVGVKAFSVIKTGFSGIGKALKIVWRISKLNVGIISDIINYFRNLFSGKTDLEGTLDGTSEKMGGILGFLQSIFGEIKKFFNGFNLWDTLNHVIDKLEEFRKFLKGGGKLSDWFKGLFKMDDVDAEGSSKGFFGKLREAFSGFTDSADTISASVGTISGAFGSLSTIFGKLSETIGKAFSDPASLRQSVGEFWNTVKSFFVDEYGKINWDTLLDLGKMGLIGFLIAKIDKTFKNLNKAITGSGKQGLLATFKEWASLPKTFVTNITSPFTALGKAIGDKSKADRYIKIAAAIGILSTSLYLLTRVDEQKLFNVAVTIGVLMGIMAHMAKAMDGFQLFSNNTKTISKNNPITNTIKAFEGLQKAFAIDLTGATANISLLPKTMGTLLGVAALLGSVVYAILKLKDIAKPGELEQLYPTFAIIGGILVAMTGITVALAAATKNSKYIGKAGWTIAAMGITIYAIVKLIKSFSEMSPATSNYNGMLSAFIAIIALLGMMALVMLAAGKLTNQGQSAITSGSAVWGVAATMLALSVLTKSLIKSLAKASQIENLTKAIVILGGLLLGFTVIFTILSAIATNGGKDGSTSILKIAAAMAILAVSLLVLVPAIALMSALPANGLLAAAGALAILAIAMSGALFILSKIDSKKLLIVAGIFLAVSIGMTALLGAIGMLTIGLLTLVAVVPWDDMKEKFQKFNDAIRPVLPTIGLLALAVLGLGVGLFLGAAGAGIFGLSFLAVSAGILLAAKALEVFGHALGALGEGLPKFIEGFSKIYDVIDQNGFKIVLVLGLIVGVVLLLRTILKDVGLDTLKTKLANAGTDIMEGLKKLIAFLQLMGPELIKMVASLIGLIGTALAILLPLAITKLVALIVTAIHGLASAIRSNSAALIAAFEDLIGSLLLLLYKATTNLIGDIIGFFGGFITEVIRLIPGVGNRVADLVEKNIFDQDKIEQNIETLSGAADRAFEKSFGRHTASVSLTPEITSTELPEEDLAKYGELLQEVGENGGNKLGTATSEKAAETVTAAEESGGGITGAVGTVFSGIGDSINTDSLMTTVSGAFTSSFGGDGVTNVLTELGSGDGDTFMSSLSGSLTGDNNTSLLENGATSVFSTFSSKLNSESTDGTSTLGHNIVIGLYKSIISNGSEWLSKAGIHSFNTYKNGVESAGQINSPSKAMMEDGRWMILGLAKGLTNNAKVLDSAGEETAGSLLDEFHQALAQVALLADDDFTVSPMITPVVDMSNVRYASSAANSMFGSLQSSYMASALARSGDISETVDYNLSNNDVIQEIQVLSQQLGQLEDAVTNMQIVLDTGVLVGSTSSKMDKQFGKMAMRRGRGN